jgi:hypothetical protein
MIGGGQFDDVNCVDEALNFDINKDLGWWSIGGTSSDKETKQKRIYTTGKTECLTTFTVSKYLIWLRVIRVFDYYSIHRFSFCKGGKMKKINVLVSLMCVLTIDA